MSLLELTLTRLRLFFREPSAVFWTFIFPILLTVALGVAFRNRPPEPVSAAVEEGPGAPELAAALRRDSRIRSQVVSHEKARTELRASRAALVVSPGPPVSYTFDPTRPESRLARALVDDALQRAAGRVDPLRVVERRVTEPGSRYVDFLVPGLIGLNIMSSGMWGVAFVIVETRQKKLLKRLIATPMRKGEFLLSFVFLRMLFLALELPVLLGFARIAFEVGVRGSLALLVALSLLGALAFAGLGLLVAARSTNTQTASGLINLVMMPMFLLSGVFFSATNFPEVMQPLIRALPLTALIDALRGIMNEGAGLAAVARPALILALVAIASFALALRAFRWS
ncbi:MAG TPA: ABC transporter permease [Anaeromyxobacteraceae bacterium]|nr:ABC transporter permease [Anaeromyxobacteraceae bacterium]